MKFDLIEFETEKMKQDLSKREKCAIYILGLIFSIVAPVKYSHQIKNLFDQILN